ncbi:hypothetical protein FE257_002527 [Aspergillus nanangensis]|uniref:Methyltransferase domain-containing protein n=1 Tax=Aspergillus nanangensis TaxID=2582783 RepID=A0AAD4GWR6_ASPNN|nr:hypothetical protein FE257_002527 [Aspergillus nanangensis]
MAITAEVLYDILGKRYEDAYATSPNLCATVESAIKMLDPNSTILDVGCGTGKPVSHMLASAGHDVSGIDISQHMVDIATAQVPGGHFQKADMRTYEPSRHFDAVFSVYSMYQISPGETYAMVFRLAEWLKEGGILVLGVTSSTSLLAGLGEYDATWDCVRVMNRRWMAQLTNQVFFSIERWKRLLESAGLAVLDVRQFTYRPDDPDHRVREEHSLIIARKAARKAASLPFLGPYPIPQGQHVPYHLNGPSWSQLSNRMDYTVLDSMLKNYTRGGRSLLLKNSNEGFSLTVDTMGQAKEYTMQFREDIPFPDGQFESVTAVSTLNHVDSITKTLRDAPGGAPWNELVQFQNAICTPLMKNNGASPNHQGYLLDIAAKYLLDHGFGHIELKQVPVRCEFTDSVVDNSTVASEIIAGLRYSADPNLEKMKERLIPQLQMHFQGTPGVIGCDMIMLVASPSTTTGCA